MAGWKQISWVPPITYLHITNFDKYKKTPRKYCDNYVTNEPHRASVCEMFCKNVHPRFLEVVPFSM